ncbi:hypothetical protein L4C54_12770 [Vibrio lamellibrachiae]|uniref:hypothetical protein n=1 Tax=Vibrio lamellibrachiae TaxID=2910253 RepID=UPI003D149990
MYLLNRNTIKLFLTLMLAIASSGAAMANTGCFSSDSDGSQWFKHEIVPTSPIVIDYNTNNWDDVEKFSLDFGHYNIEDARSFSIRVKLKERTTEAMSISGRLEGENGANGGSNNANRDELLMHLNSARYFDRLEDGRLLLGLGRTDSYEAIEVVKFTAEFCGVAIPDADGIQVNAINNNIGAGNGEFNIHYIDSDTTYRVIASGEARDENDNIISSVSVNYVDPRDQQNKTLQLNTNEEFYINTNGIVSLYYAIDSFENTGGHNVRFERVNLD